MDYDIYSPFLREEVCSTGKYEPRYSVRLHSSNPYRALRAGLRLFGISFDKDLICRIDRYQGNSVYLVGSEYFVVKPVR